MGGEREKERDKRKKGESYILSPESVLINIRITAFLILRLWLIIVSKIWKCFKYVVPGSLFYVYSYFSFLLDFRGCRSAIGQFGITWASTRFGETNTQLCPTGEGKKFDRGPYHIVLVAS